MKKNTLRTILVSLFLIGLYNLIAFVIPFEHTDVFWICYGFGIGAFVIVAASVYIAFMQIPNARSLFYGFPIIRIGVLYGIFQLVASFVGMILATYLVWWIPVVVFSVGFCAAALGLIATEAVVEEINRQDEALANNVSLMRSLQSKVSQIAASTDNAGIRALSEEFRYSDPVSNSSLAEIEADLEAVVSNLQEAYVDGDRQALDHLCRRASVLLAERNRQCKLSKHH